VGLLESGFAKSLQIKSLVASLLFPAIGAAGAVLAKGKVQKYSMPVWRRPWRNRGAEDEDAAAIACLPVSSVRLNSLQAQLPQRLAKGSQNQDSCCNCDRIAGSLHRAEVATQAAARQ
jgi:hypothetical protein